MDLIVENSDRLIKENVTFCVNLWGFYFFYFLVFFVFVFVMLVCVVFSDCKLYGILNYLSRIWDTS